MSAAIALWRRLDGPGHDVCRLVEVRDGWRLEGTAVFSHEGAPVRLDYDLTCDDTWHTRDGAVRGWVGERAIDAQVVRSPDGLWHLNGALVDGLEGCVDLDYGFTPATNLVQLRRLGLALGDEADVPVAWLDVPDVTLTRLDQRYRRVRDDAYAYDADRFDYHAVLEIAESGFARTYPRLWELEAP